MMTTAGFGARARRFAGRRTFCLLTTWVILAAGTDVRRAQAQAQPGATHQFLPPPGTYIADAFALREDGAQLAYVTTGGTKNFVLHVVDLGTTPRQREIAIPGRVESLHWLGPGRLLVVGPSKPGGRLVGSAFNEAGPEASIVGPADHIALGAWQGKPVITAYTRARGKAGLHELVAFDPVALQPVTSRKFQVDQRQRLEVNGEKVRLLWWGQDFTFAAVRHPGKYDPARDLRLPDRFGRVDLLSNTLIDDAPIVPSGFARLASFQRLHPGESLFVHLDPRDQKLLLVDGANSRTLEPVRPLGKYDPSRMSTQIVGSDEVLVSLTVDPLNREAAARRQRDPHEIEIYSVNRATGAMKLRLILNGENRPARWHAGGGNLALLRQHRGFSRGGVVLQVYALPETVGRHLR